MTYSQSSPEHTNEDHPSLHSPKKQTQNFKSLRNHGLVSNSIFKQIDGGSQPSSLTNSPRGSPSRKPPTSPSFGLGIGISSSTQTTQHTLKSNLSDADDDAENSNPFNLYATVPSAKGPQRKLPRKSLGRLHESNYVSNSVFRQQHGESDELSSPSSPLTPSRAAVQQAPQSSPASASRGLLISNRLHGPRFMNDSPQGSIIDSGLRSELSSPLRNERRKTVTFDEILDVQEFDKESSFDAESLRDTEDHEHGQADTDFWTQQGVATASEAPMRQLQVVNGDDAHASSDEAAEVISAESEPDLSHDSNDTSSIEGPSSPTAGDGSLELQDLSLQRTLAAQRSCTDEQGFPSERENSFARLSAADRVDSMMDELLRDDILSNPSVRSRETSAGEQEAPEPLSGRVETTANPPRLEQAALPQLPAWSPLSLDVDVAAPLLGDSGRSRTEPQIAQTLVPIPPPTTRNGSVRGRPHISRDAILQRVAREKLNQEQAKSEHVELDNQTQSPVDQQTTTVDSNAVKRSVIQQRRMPRGSEPGPSTVSAEDAPPTQDKFATAARPSAPLHQIPTKLFATETKPIPSPSPVRELEKLESPLDLLGMELKMTADLDPQSANNNAKASAPPLLDSFGTESGDTTFTNMLEVSTPQADPASTASAHLTPAQHADQIIARRRSKNGKGRRKRSMSTSDARPIFTAAVADAVVDTDNTSTSTTSESSGESLDEQVELPTRQSISADLAKSKAMLDVSLQRAIDGGFQTNMEKELTRIYQKGDSNYNVNDRGAFKGIDDKVTHTAAAGDVDSGKAWKKLRRPSDINEYKKEMREIREGSNARKAAGKVFVMVDSFTPTVRVLDEQLSR